MIRTQRKNAQSTIEYAFFLIVVIAVFLTMQHYVKRGLQGRWKDAVDEIGDQYDPLTAHGYMVHVIDSNSTSEIITCRVADGINTHRWDKSNSFETRDGEIYIDRMRR